MSTRRVGMMMTRMRMIIRMAIVMMIALMILKKLPSEIGSLRNADLLNGCSIVVETKNDETDP